jgi:heptosyltransferase-2
VKAILKNIYLNFRKYLLRVVAIFILDKKIPHSVSGLDIRKILFIRIDRIGDMVLSTPALKALKQEFPQCKLVVLASPSNQPLLAHNPYVDRVIVYGHKNGLRKKIGSIKQLRGYGFDLAIDPYPDYELKTALIAFVSGAKSRIGYASYGREIFFNLHGPGVVEDKHLIDLTLDIIKPLGVVANDKRPEIFLTEDEKEWARNWLEKRGVGGRPMIGIHPGGYYETQRWLPERFADIANHLQKSGDLDVIILGGPGDERLVHLIRSMIHAEVPTYVGDDLRRFATLVHSCHILICNNSGPLHIAAALNIPTISFMGPTDKKRWMPIGEFHKVLRIDNLSCIGCNLGYCKIRTHDCMRLITPSMVIDAVKDFMKI